MTDEEIDELLVSTARDHNLTSMSVAMVGVMEKRPDLTPAHFERRFRALGLPFELVALPRDRVAQRTDDPRVQLLGPERPAAQEIEVRMLPSGLPAEWWLYFCLRGEGAAMKEEIGVDDEENLRRLDTAGFMTINEQPRLAVH